MSSACSTGAAGKVQGSFGLQETQASG